MSRIIRPRFEIGMQGFFRFQTRNKFSGKVTSDTGWFPNTILNAGRNIMATEPTWMTWCQVGTDGTFPPLLVDRQNETTLGAWHAGTNVIVSGSVTNGQSGTAPYYGWKRKTWRFDAGTVNTNLSEAAVGWGIGGPATPDTIISRAPILDPILGTPTTVTPLIDEMLDVSYELRYYAPVTDILLPQVTLDGVVYDTITRAANATGGGWSDYIGDKIGYYVFDSTTWHATDGPLGAVNSSPSGNLAASTSGIYSNGSYSANSYEITVGIAIGSLGWNTGAGGIQSIRIATTAGWYQTQFNSNPGGLSIPKDNTYQMDMKWTLSWAEYVTP